MADVPAIAARALAAALLIAALCLGLPATPTPAVAEEGPHAGQLRRSAQSPILCWPDPDERLSCHPAAIEELPGFPQDRIRQVKVGRDHLCALLTDRTLTCWGWGPCVHGECESPEGRFLGFNVGVGSNCALRVDGVMHCWGWDGLKDPYQPPPEEQR